jgi:hypothetical protein
MDSARGRISVAIVAMALMAVLASPAQGGRPAKRGRRPEPMAHVACRIAPGVLCEESGSITMPPTSFGSQSTDTVPAKATQATVDLTPPPTTEDTAAFDHMVITLADAKFPKLTRLSKASRRILGCVLFSYSAVADTDVRTNITTVDPTYQLLALDLCLRTAAQIAAANAPPSASDASAACSRAAKAVPITVTRTRSGYVGKATGTTHTLSGGLPLNISCRRIGRGLRFTLRPSARGTKLRQLIGSKLSIGFVNPSNKSTRINTTYRFR